MYHMYVWRPQKSLESMSYPGTRVTDVVKHHECSDNGTNPGSLIKQQVFLTTVTFLQTSLFSFLYSYHMVQSLYLSFFMDKKGTLLRNVTYPWPLKQ